MRKIEYLSPTSFALFEKDPEEFYKRYLSERRFPREPQTIQMALGSAFDYIVKKYLTDALQARLLNPSAALPDAQIEPQNLPDAMTIGQSIFDFYQRSGALASTVLMIVDKARFEFSVTGNIAGAAGSVPLNGRPDAYFYSGPDGGVPVVLDWKVNSWVRGVSPKAGYVESFGFDGARGQHKRATPAFHAGVLINLNGPDGAIEWCDQLCVYGWLLGVPVGTPFIGAIDQLVGPANEPRCAKHRFLIGRDYQLRLHERYVNVWKRVTGVEPLFSDCDSARCAERCAALDQQIDMGGLA